MTDVVVGVLALVIGLLLCFRGSGAMRVLLALWGAFIGFGLGAVLVAALADQGYLATAAGWIAAIVLAVVFAALAYFFFAIAIVLAFASMGFVVGQTIASALGVSQPWLLVVVGLVGGIVLGLLAIATNLPELVLIVVSALAGAGVAVAGLLLLFNALDLNTLTDAELRIGDQPLWYVGQIVLAVIGIVVQLRYARRRRLGSVRQSWAATGAV
ncbi:DUF4203 domain-containing protein [Occultella aeris]|uniref:DUF4203 domain-containing protein n=1 Tax=Occultella aeris TaxID=2761496 RepID=A0A7M4DRD8_9MICO|nr:DUF4203 domain-containing protein [Occultella aeris]VZO40032.1 hypothetical protein HALOF300_04733 [Occultella aeris]